MFAELEKPTMTTMREPNHYQKLKDDMEMAILERDEAFKVRDIATKETKALLAWIHVTHRLGNVPKEGIRALFAAGIRLKVALLFFVTLSAFGQAPPLQRNRWTTNAAPKALTTVLTNGVRAATNIWELDFTNTATVTVSAVSNANKVMLSFSGSDASTNYWTNFSVADIGGGTIDGIRDVNPKVRTASFAANDVSFWGEESSIITLGFNAGSPARDGTNSASVLNLGDYAGNGQNLSESSRISSVGPNSGENQSIRGGSDAIFNFGVSAGKNQVLNNASDIFNIGIRAGYNQNIDTGTKILHYGYNASENARFTNSNEIFSYGQYTHSIAEIINSSVIQGFGYYAGNTMRASNSGGIFNYGYGAGRDLNVTNSYSIFTFGYNPAKGSVFLQSTNLYAYGTAASSNQVTSGGNRIYSYGAYSMSDSRMTNSADIYGFGSYALRDAKITSSDRIFGLDYDAFEHAIITNCQSISAYGFEAFESAILTGSSNIVAIGPHAGTNLTLTGVSNILILGNIGTAVPVTDEFHVGRTQNVYRFHGNIGTIRNVSGYSWPTAHASGALTNDGSGNLGWGSAGGQTPWTSDINAAAFSLTNFNALHLTNGMQLVQPAPNHTRLTNGTLELFSGATNRIALVVTNNQSHMMTNLALFNGGMMSNGSLVTIRGTWQNDNIHFPPAFLVDMNNTASGSLTPIVEFRIDGSSVHSFKRSGFYDIGGNATIAAVGALTTVHGASDDLRIRPVTGSGSTIGFYNSSSVRQNGLRSASTNRIAYLDQNGAANILLSGCIFSSTADRGVTNSTTETTVIGIGDGTLTLPVHTLIPGRTIRITVSGIFSDDAVTPGTVTVVAKLGSTTVCSTGAQTPAAGVANGGWKAVIHVTCRTAGGSGTVMAHGAFENQGTALAESNWWMVNTGTTTIDTTATQAIDVTWDWGTADSDNSTTGQIALVEVLR